MASGDVGRFDSQGRLYVEGRDDDMIVSGGENVFPQEIEDCLARHERVVEAAAIGVDDDAFGRRLRAFVVVSEPRPTRTSSRTGCAPTSPDTRSRARSCSSMSFLATRLARCSSASSPNSD